MRDLFNIDNMLHSRGILTTVEVAATCVRFMLDNADNIVVVSCHIWRHITSAARMQPATLLRHVQLK